MSIKKFIVAVLVSSAFFALPLVASANNYFITGASNGTATATFSDITGVSTKISKTMVRLSNGVIENNESTDFLRDDFNNPALKFTLANLTVLYPNANGTAMEGSMRLWTSYSYLLRTGNGTSSGAGMWEMQFPSQNYAATHATTAGRMYDMSGSCRLGLAVNGDLKGVLKASQMVPDGAWYYPYTSDGLGNPDSITFGEEFDMDGGNVSMPAMNIQLILAP
jgi:hypothetical protein